MKKNMGAGDRVIRIVAGVVLVALLATGTVSGTLGVVLGVMGGVLILTSAMGWCPAYLPFKFSTCKKELPQP